VILAIVKWIIIVSALLNFGYMAFDGTRGLIIGDYIRPKSGQYAGQLGPWSKIVKSVGIDPESAFMKIGFLAWGLIGIIITVCFALNLKWSWQGMLLMNISSLWYLFLGTGLSALQIILLGILKILK
jgi:hypothetical protein